MPFVPDAPTTEKRGFVPDVVAPPTREELIAQIPGATVRPPEPEQDVGGQYFNALPKMLQPVARVGVGAGETAASVLSTIPAAAKTALEYLPGTGDPATKPQGTFLEKMAQSSYAPKTETGKVGVKGLGKLLENLQPVLNEFPGFGSLLQGLGKSAPSAIRALSDAGVSGSTTLGELASKVKLPNMPIVSTLRGKDAAKATAEAQGVTREALKGASEGVGKEQAAAATHAKELTDAAARAEKAIAASGGREGRPTLDVQGENVRRPFVDAIEKAKQTRSGAANENYSKARESAAAKEAAGARVDVSEAVKPLETLMAESEQIPTLNNELKRMFGAVKGSEAKPTGLLDANGKPIPSSQPSGFTYKELSLSNRYLKDIAYSRDIEGYGSVVRNAAKDASKKLDEALAKFVPEHAKAEAEYSKLSEPLESLGTRFGRIVYDTEGGIKGEAYAKTAAQDIPSRIFSKKEGIELMVDALAGGKNASPQARAIAQKAVDKMHEDWLVETVRGASNKTGSKALEALNDPQKLATMQGASPQSVKNIRGMFEREAAHEKTAAEAKAGLPQAQKVADDLKAKKAAIDSAIKHADIDASIPGKASQQKAYDGYVSAIRSQMENVDPKVYRSALEYINKAATLEEKTKRARQLAWRFGTAVVIGAGVGETIGFGKDLMK